MSLLVVPAELTKLVPASPYDAMVKDLSWLFATALRDMGRDFGGDDPVGRFWDGKSFAPLAEVLTKLSASGAWTPEYFAKFLAVLSDRPLPGPDDAGWSFLNEGFASDPVLSAFGDIGLSPKFFFGAGFGGADLMKLGTLFQQEFQPGDHPANRAPQVTDGAPTEILTAEGKGFGLALAKIFSDADGDTLQFRVEGGTGRLEIAVTDEGVLKVSPGFAAAGKHELVLIASDGQSEVAHKMVIAVEEAGHGTRILTSDFSRILSTAETLDDALATVARSRAVDILDQSAVGNGIKTVSVDNLTLNARAPVTMALELTGAARQLAIRGEATVDLTGNKLDNFITATSGNDVIRGVAGTNQIWGGAGDDSIFGGTGLDKLYGDAGNDRLFGGEGDDQLYGGDGSDWLRGDAGRDQAWGGAGADVFEFVRGDGTFTLRDVVAKEDVIRMVGFDGIRDAESLRTAAQVQEFADFTRVTVAGEVLNIYGIKAQDISDALFSFG